MICTAANAIQASKTLRSMSIAHAQFERQAQRERERQRTEQQGDKDLEAALKHATQVIENQEADVISLRQAQRVQRVSDSEDDKKSNMLETSVADFETQPAILKVNCVTVLRQSACSEVVFFLDHCACCARALKQDVCASMVSASSTKEAQCVHRVSDLDHEDGLEAQFALLEVNRVKVLQKNAGSGVAFCLDITLCLLCTRFKIRLLCC